MARIYAPLILKEDSLQGQADDFNLVEIRLIYLLSHHPEQGRKHVLINFTLCAVARDYAERMAKERFEGHKDPNGFGPNDRVREAGYSLPDFYSKTKGANNVESLEWDGDGDPEKAWVAWLTSSPHKTHLLGLDKFYADQNCIGMGYYYDPKSIHKHYYCFLSAICP